VNSRFHRNAGGNRGGVAVLQGSSASFYGCQLLENYAGKGGAIFNGARGNVTIKDTLFGNNSAYGLGGAIFSQDADVTTLDGATFAQNTAKDAGAAIYCAASSFDVRGAGVIFTDNKDASGSNSNFACSDATTLVCNILSTDKKWHGICDDKFTPIGGGGDGGGINIGNLPLPLWASILIGVGALLFLGVLGFVLTVVIYRRCHAKELMKQHHQVRFISCTLALSEVMSYSRNVTPLITESHFCYSYARQMFRMRINSCGPRWRRVCKMTNSPTRHSTRMRTTSRACSAFYLFITILFPPLFVQYRVEIEFLVVICSCCKYFIAPADRERVQRACALVVGISHSQSSSFIAFGDCILVRGVSRKDPPNSAKSQVLVVFTHHRP
jgi:predicted outer membrane repeat protein